MNAPRREIVPAGRQAAGSEAVEAVVCVPTYRRPALLSHTLASLAGQVTRRAFRVLVVDNDAEHREGLAIAEAMLATGPLAGLAVLQPKQGNCHAINAAFETARATFPAARYLLMIDDDEIASPQWLEELIAAAERTGVDVVGGPVYSRFDPQPKPPIARHPVFWPAFDRSGPVPMIYGSGNFLIRQEAMNRLPDPAFHESFNFLGGGDTDFFTRCRRAGLRFYWSQEARIDETVPAARQNAGWILRRGLRIGAVNFRIDRRNAPSVIAVAVIHLKNIVLLPVSLTRSTRLLAQNKSLLEASHPTMVAVGRLLASLGIELHQYRATRTP